MGAGAMPLPSIGWRGAGLHYSREAPASMSSALPITTHIEMLRTFCSAGMRVTAT